MRVTYEVSPRARRLSCSSTLFLRSTSSGGKSHCDVSCSDLCSCLKEDTSGSAAA